MGNEFLNETKVDEAEDFEVDGFDEAEDGEEPEEAEMSEALFDDESDGSSEGGDKEDGDSKDGDDEGGRISPTDSQWKALRKTAEARANAKATEEVQRFKDSQIAAQYGHVVNPYTGNKITTEAEYQNYVENYEAEQNAAALQEAGLSVEVLNKMIANHPAIKKAEQLIEQMETQAAAQAFDSAIVEISKLNPNIKDFEDLTAMENFEVFNQLVLEKGYDMVDAYMLASMGETIKAEKENAAAATASAMKRNAKASPGAMKGGGGKTSDVSSMSDEEFETFMEKVKNR